MELRRQVRSQVQLGNEGNAGVGRNERKEKMPKTSSSYLPATRALATKIVFLCIRRVVASLRGTFLSARLALLFI
jgi:hypothetical protein